MKIIKIPIYQKQFILSINKEEALDILKKYRKDYKLDDLDDLGGCVYPLDKSYLSLFYISALKLSIINHEIVHLATSCLNNGDTYDFRGNDENLAYLVQYLTEIIYKELKIESNWEI